MQEETGQFMLSPVQGSLNLLTECDFFVIQVHGLDIANETLMQRETALKAIQDADSFGKNYRVALPCYAYQLNYRKSDGKLLFVSAEDTPGQNDELEQKTVEGHIRRYRRLRE